MTGRHDLPSLLRLPAVAEAVLGAAPAWLWDVEAGRVVAASAAGAAFFEAPDPAALATRTFDMRRPAMMQLARLSGQLPADGAPRMAMLRFFVGLRDVSFAGRCRLVDPFRRDLVLVLAIGLAPDRRPLAERAATVFGALAAPVALRGPQGEIYRNAAAVGAALPADAPSAVRLAVPDGSLELVLGDAGGEASASGAGEAAPVDGRSAPPPAGTAGSGGGASETEAGDAAPGSSGREPVSAVTQPPAAPGPRRLPETRRFTFLLDADGRFAEIGAGFAGIVGPAAADVAGRHWPEIAAEYRLDPDGRIAAALASRDTWSDILVDWPTDYGDAVRLRLSALPRYAEGRAFAGFRGFADALAILPLSGPAATESPPTPSAPAGPGDPGGTDTPPAGEEAADQPDGDEVRAGDVVFAEPEDRQQVTAEAPDGHSPRIIRLKPALPEPAEEGSGLNERERTAFRAIARALGARLPDEDAPPAEAAGDTPQGGPDRPDAPGMPGTDPQSAAAAAGRDDGDGGELPPATDDAGDDAPEQDPRPGACAVEAAAPPGDEAESGVAAADAPPLAMSEAAASEPASGPVGSESDPSGIAARGPAAAGPVAAAVPEADSPPDIADSPADTAAAAPAIGPALIGEILDRVPLGLAVVRDARILVANRAFLELFAFEDLADLESAGGLAGLLEGRAPTEDDEHAHVVARRRDGTLMPVAMHLARTPWVGGPAMLLSARPPEPAPTPATPLPEASAPREAPVDTELADLRAVVAMAVDGVLVLGPDGAIASANPGARRLLAGLDGELLGRPLVDCVAPGSRSHALDLIEGLKAGGVPSVLAEGREIRLIAPDGEGTPVHMKVGRIGSGQPPRFCAVLRDLTDRKAAEEALVEARRRAEEASAQKSDFLAKISHEIRTPLNGIIGFSEVMGEERFGPLGNERYREYVRDIRASGEHIMSLVNDLLDLSKVEAGKLDLAFAGVRLNDLVEQTVAIVGPQANRAQIIIRTSLAATLPPVVADARSIRQVVLNLLSNAIKFTLPGGQVFVSTVHDETGEVVLRVRDTGIGMSETEITAAMEPFRQLAVAGSERERGTGLGLPLSKALTEANRASFTITSRTGEGTMIEIRFPQNRVLSE